MEAARENGPKGVARRYYALHGLVCCKFCMHAAVDFLTSNLVA
jgi:hypothetical protein